MYNINVCIAANGSYSSEESGFFGQDCEIVKRKCKFLFELVSDVRTVSVGLRLWQK